jgi:hypothetical protein
MRSAFISSLRGGVAATLCLVALAANAQPDLTWTTERNEQGATVDYPRTLLPVSGQPANSDGLLFATTDGRGRLEIFTVPNRQGESPAAFTHRIAQKGEQLTYNRVARNFFAASTVRDGRILYRRCNFSADKIHCIDLRYPADQKRAWDRIVTRVSLSLRPR